MINAHLGKLASLVTNLTDYGHFLEKASWAKLCIEDRIASVKGAAGGMEGSLTADGL